MATTASPTASGTQSAGHSDLRTQACAFIMELSPDWLVLRASENTHGFLGEYPARLIGEPLSSFTLAQPLHDLRNSLARQRSSNGIARAYRIRLTDEPRYFDIAFQQLESSILLEALPSSGDGFGDSLGAVSRLIDRMNARSRQALMDDACRRMRALTGFDRATLTISDGDRHDRAESARSAFAAPATPGLLPGIVADANAQTIGIYPAANGDSGLGSALLRALSPDEQEELRRNDVRSVLSVPIARGGDPIGCFRCENRTPRTPSLELHAAAELFAQIVGIELERLPD